ncbi:cytochrome B mRNA processing [Orobanche gracilis]
MLPIYQELIAAGIRIWVFSGDTDAWSVGGAKYTKA